MRFRQWLLVSETVGGMLGMGGVDLGLRCWQGGIEGDWLQIGVDIFIFIYAVLITNQRFCGQNWLGSEELLVK